MAGLDVRRRDRMMWIDDVNEYQILGRTAIWRMTSILNWSKLMKELSC